MDADILFGEHEPFLDKFGRELRFIKFFPNVNRIQCWQINMGTVSSCNATCMSIPVSEVSKKVLEEIGVWQKMSSESRTAFDQSEQQVKATVIDRMKQARKARKPRSEYAHIPREITCPCGKVDKIAPGVFVKKANLLCINDEVEQQKIADFIASYRCAECVPRRRGRQRNPLYKDIPRSVPCSKCGKDCVINAKAVYEQTKGKKPAIKKYCDEYLCRKCNPEWGSWLKGKRRGKKCKPENEGFPKKVKCIGCGKEISIVPDQIRKKAKRMKVTVEHLLANYRCRSCGGVVPHKKRRKKK